MFSWPAGGWKIPEKKKKKELRVEVSLTSISGSREANKAEHETLGVRPKKSGGSCRSCQTIGLSRGYKSQNQVPGCGDKMGSGEMM